MKPSVASLKSCFKRSDSDPLIAELAQNQHILITRVVCRRKHVQTHILDIAQNQLPWFCLRMQGGLRVARV
jgi:hypothetical protein